MIEAVNITKSYKMGEVTLNILKGISLTIEPGDFVAIMGPSGSGKSTLMNILGLLDTPTSGQYKLNSVEVSQRSEDELAIIRRNEIGFIFQQFNLLPRMSALANVDLPLLYSQLYPHETRGKDLLSRVGLETRMTHKPSELSGGQQQRVAIARSLINNPKIVFADEPTGNLDTQSQVEIMKILEELNQSGITVIIVTHEEEVAAHAKRWIRLRDGVIISDERRSPLEKNNIPLTQSITHQTKTSAWQNILNYFQLGVKTLAANKVRTALSMLGILIGVGAVVAMLALGSGAKKAIEEQLSSLGSNLLNVRPGAIRVGGITQESGAANRLIPEDLALIKSHVSNVKNVSGQVNGRGQLTANAKNWNTFIQGTSETWDELHNSVPTIGRFFTEDENLKRARVAVIGETIQRELFNNTNPIGEMIKINKINFQIIGVLPPKGANAFRDQDDVVIIPVLTAMKRVFGRDYLEMLEVEIDRPENIPQAQEEIRQVITNQHKIPISQQGEAYVVRNMADIQATMQQSSQTMSVLLASIAAISLLVGGIGIMNIMLVSVTERTREIGLRKAIGAMRKDILSQFLAESVVISVIGGLIGIFLGWISTVLISQVADWSTSITLESVLLSFGFSVAIGIIFGVYPARKASRLNPIDALRYE
ncbi:MAG: macrolide export ATP-binding/permease protein MacB [Oligoflexia bacterium]|nr:MAG: macrolide export ATP-binding/permease protein MacB [Oligoflexia bacterium]